MHHRTRLLSEQLPLFNYARPRALAERPLREWPGSERPLNRLTTHGAAALSDSELLAIIFHPNPQAIALAGELLSRFGSWQGIQQASDVELQQVVGIGPVRAAQLVAMCEIARRLATVIDSIPTQIRSPADIAALLLPDMQGLDQEELRVVCLSTKNHVQKVVTVYRGNVNSSMIRVGEVFKAAIRLNSTAMIIAHNHPSGDPTPSPEDVLVTRQIVEAGQLLDIDILDHLVIGRGRWISMRERGLGFK